MARVKTQKFIAQDKARPELPRNLATPRANCSGSRSSASQRVFRRRWPVFVTLLGLVGLTVGAVGSGPRSPAPFPVRCRGLERSSAAPIRSPAFCAEHPVAVFDKVPHRPAESWRSGQSWPLSKPVEEP